MSTISSTLFSDSHTHKVHDFLPMVRFLDMIGIEISLSTYTSVPLESDYASSYKFPPYKITVEGAVRVEVNHEIDAICDTLSNLLTETNRQGVPLARLFRLLKMEEQRRSAFQNNPALQEQFEKIQTLIELAAYQRY